jgi:hypothetical protein
MWGRLLVVHICLACRHMHCCCHCCCALKALTCPVHIAMRSVWSGLVTHSHSMHLSHPHSVADSRHDSPLVDDNAPPGKSFRSPSFPVIVGDEPPSSSFLPGHCLLSRCHRGRRSPRPVPPACLHLPASCSSQSVDLLRPHHTHTHPPAHPPTHPPTHTHPTRHTHTPHAVIPTFHRRAS